MARAPSRTSTPSDASSCAAFADSFGLNAVSTRSPASSSTTRVSAGSKRGELAPQVVAGEHGELAGDLDAGRAAADHHERREALALGGVVRALGLLEAGQDLLAQRDAHPTAS